MVQIIRDRQNTSALQRVKDVRQIVGFGGADEKNVATLQIGIIPRLPAAGGMADLPDDDRVTVDAFVGHDAFAVAVKRVASQHADDQWRISARKGAGRPFNELPKIVDERSFNPVIGRPVLLRLYQPVARQHRRQQATKQQCGPAHLRQP